MICLRLGPPVPCERSLFRERITKLENAKALGKVDTASFGGMFVLCLRCGVVLCAC